MLQRKQPNNNNNNNKDDNNKDDNNNISNNSNNNNNDNNNDNINISSNTIVYWYERCVRVLFQTNATVTIIVRTATRQMRCHRVAHGANEAEEPKSLRAFLRA